MLKVLGGVVGAVGGLCDFSDNPEAKFTFSFLDLTGSGTWTWTSPGACQ